MQTRWLWPILFTLSNILCSLQLMSDSKTLSPFTRQYTHMTLLLTAIYAAVVVKQLDAAAVCVICFSFSVQWHSGNYDWRLPDGWFSRVAILYIVGRVVVDKGLAAIVATTTMVATTWVWPNLEDTLFFTLLGVGCLLLIFQYKKMFWWDILASAIFAISGYCCYLMGDRGLHGLWHSFMATAIAFAITVPKKSSWHLLVPVKSTKPSTSEEPLLSAGKLWEPNREPNREPNWEPNWELTQLRF
jgi:hypothetical protein